MKKSMKKSRKKSRKKTEQYDINKSFGNFKFFLLIFLIASVLYARNYNFEIKDIKDSIINRINNINVPIDPITQTIDIVSESINDFLNNTKTQISNININDFINNIKTRLPDINISKIYNNISNILYDIFHIDRYIYNYIKEYLFVGNDIHGVLYESYTNYLLFLKEKYELLTSGICNAPVKKSYKYQEFFDDNDNMCFINKQLKQHYLNSFFNFNFNKQLKRRYLNSFFNFNRY